MPTLWSKQGDFRKVIFDRDEVNRFNRSWPGSKLEDRGYWFEFARNGDLVDTDIPEHSDGPEALALSQDAQEWLRAFEPDFFQS